MNWINFSEKINIIGVNPYILVNKERIKLIKKDWKRNLPVIVKVNNIPEEGHNINLVPVGNGEFYLYLNQVIREASKTKVGDFVEVMIKFDISYKNGPTHKIPYWFGKSLKESAIVKKNWESLIPSRKKEVLRYFSRLKSEAAINRNLDKIIQALSGKRIRFMGREWNNGL